MDFIVNSPNVYSAIAEYLKNSAILGGIDLSSSYELLPISTARRNMHCVSCIVF